jgi:hypothetical protein
MERRPGSALQARLTYRGTALSSQVARVIPDALIGRDRVERAKTAMSARLSLSIFTIEADRKPVLAFAAKKYHEAEAFLTDERVRTKLGSVQSGGIPLCDHYSILRIRLAHPDERTRYHEQTRLRSSVENSAAVFLVDVDEAERSNLATQY